jgi:hypothetical protein
VCAHVRCCPACAEALAAEARRELALTAIVPRVARGRRAVPAANGHRGGSPLLAFAAAALALLVSMAGNPAGRGLGSAGGPVDAEADGETLLASVLPASPMVCVAETEAAVCGRPAQASLPISLPADQPGGFCAGSEATCRLQSRIY